VSQKDGSTSDTPRATGQQNQEPWTEVRNKARKVKMDQQHNKEIEDLKLKMSYLQKCYEIAIKFVPTEHYDTLFYLLDELSNDHFVQPIKIK
jgi:hypothetical protein